MIDIHTHILPRIDDGAKDIAEAINMTENLYLQGVTTAVCTPHFNPARTSIEIFLSNRKRAYESLKKTRIKLIEASETYLHEYLFHYDDLSPLCISNTNYLLLELPFDKKWPASVYANIEKLRYYYDVIPIIAHVERYDQILKSTKTLKYLKAMGCLIQINTTTIIDKKYRHFITAYLKYDYLDVLGSDCHNMTSRPPLILEAKDEIIIRSGMDQWNRLIENSQKVIGNS